MPPTPVAAGHGLGLALFPLVAAVVALVFSGRLVARLLKRAKLFEVTWAVALLMFAAASFAMFVGIVHGWRPVDFRVYWLFGAVLNVPYLFAGEVYLLARGRSWGHFVLAVTVVASVYAGVIVWGAHVNVPALSATLPLGKDVFGSTLAHGLAQIYGNLAYGLLLVGLLWSVVRMRGQPELRDQMTGVLLIAVGASVVAVGSGIGAAFGIVALFSVSLAAGVGLMFAGFLRAGRPRSTP